MQIKQPENGETLGTILYNFMAPIKAPSLVKLTKLGNSSPLARYGLDPLVVTLLISRCWLIVGVGTEIPEREIKNRNIEDRFSRDNTYLSFPRRNQDLDFEEQGLISPTYYKQLLRVQIPKTLKDTDVLAVSLCF